jgi:hypothetical protein
VNSLQTRDTKLPRGRALHWPPGCVSLWSSRWPVGRPALAPRRSRRRHDAARQDPRHDRPERRHHARARLPEGSAVVSATNGKTTTAALVAEILSPALRLAHNHSGANLVSGVASTLLEPRCASSACSRSTRARSRTSAARSGRARSASATSSATSSTGTASSSASPSAGARLSGICRGRDARRQRRRSRSSAIWRRTAASVTFGLDDPAHARPSLQHAADSKYCIRCGTPYDYAAAYVGHLGDYRCPACGHAGRPLELAARGSSSHGLEAPRSTSSPRGHARVRIALPGLYNVYNALAAAALAARSARPRRDRAGLGGPLRVRAGRANRDRRRRLLSCSVKNPPERTRSVRTLVAAGAPEVAVIALNDAIADGRDVSWIWDVDFEPLLAGLERLVVSGERAAELALRCVYGGLPRDAIEIVPDLAAALDRGLELTPAGGELTVLPTYTAMLTPAQDRCRARTRQAVLGARSVRVVRLRLSPAGETMFPPRAPFFQRPSRLGEPPGSPGPSPFIDRKPADEDPCRTPLSRVSEHLRRPREHRGARGPRGRRGLELDITAVGLGEHAATGRVRPPLRRRRPGPGAGTDRTGHGLERPCAGRSGRRRRSVSRRLRRLPAARPLLPRPVRLGAAGRRGSPAPHRGGRAADDRRRPARVRAPAGQTATLAGFENHAGRTSSTTALSPSGGW